MHAAFVCSLAGGCRWSLVEGFGQAGGAHPESHFGACPLHGQLPAEHLLGLCCYLYN